MIPLSALRGGPSGRTRLCCYADTPTGDSLIDHHPDWDGSLLPLKALGMHSKFPPAVGGKIVDSVVGKRPEEFKEKWAWKSALRTEYSVHCH